MLPELNLDEQRIIETLRDGLKAARRRREHVYAVQVQLKIRKDGHDWICECEPVSLQPAALAPAPRQCVKDVVKTLRQAGRPLSRMKLYQEMDQRGRRWSRKEIRHALVELRATGTVRYEGGYRLAGA